MLDEQISTYTKTIAFTSKENTWPLEVFDRNKALSKCEEASLFLNRNEIKLLPDDFSITFQATGDDVVKQLLRKLDTIMSYVYVANNSYVAEDKIVVQFDPAGKGFDKKLNDVEVSSAISRIYQYVYGSDTAIERAGIARNIISLNCKSDDQIWNIDDEVISSIKSNFTLYQKSAVEKYIETKNKISDYIIETSKQIQEMTHELAEGLRNNFIAVIMFLITVILTDSMDWDDLLSGGIPRDIVYMSYLFAAASLVYWLITILGTYRKWTYCADGYNRLKDNYKDLLEEKDLNKAFGNDEVKNKAKKQIIRDAIIVSVIWIAFLVAMVWFFTWMKVQVVPVP
ncbi:hypothetical protein [Bullifex porci]|uniref:hypothetical protein n=1 Tax=Bullifex porci TaxID=2606638 RepID=UPI0023F39D27|nr:hypothetical protein [Bullifex porci]MDD7256381.1 hypothetical protein [Bullifex porci]